MEAEKGRADEEVVHRVDVDAFDCGEDEEQKEKEKEGDGSSLGHVLYPRAWVEAGGHDHAESGPGEQLVVLPSETPALGGALLVGGRQALAGEVNGGEIREHGQLEVGNLLDVVAEAVLPLFESLRLIGKTDLAALARR